jgi:hypothetical protein
MLVHTAVQPRRQPSSYLPSWEPHVILRRLSSIEMFASRSFGSLFGKNYARKETYAVLSHYTVFCLFSETTWCKDLEPTASHDPELVLVIPHNIILRFILTVSSNTLLCLTSGLFPGYCPTKILHAYLVLPSEVHVQPLVVLLSWQYLMT